MTASESPAKCSRPSAPSACEARPITSLRSYPWRALTPAWLALLTGSWAADGVRDALLAGNVSGRNLALTFVAFAVLVASSLWLYVERASLLGPRHLYRRRCEPHSSVILLVSPSNLPVTGVGFPLGVVSGAAEAVLQGESLDADIEALDRLRWNWQQLLRAVVPHRSRLQRITLIGSPAPTGSFGQLELCVAILQRYLPAVSVRAVSRPVDFEDFGALVECIRRLIAEERAEGVSEADIIVDVTGGFKTASIAAASVTMNRNVTFQYVQTVPPYDVYAYNVAFEAGSSPEG